MNFAKMRAPAIETAVASAFYEGWTYTGSMLRQMLKKWRRISISPVSQEELDVIQKEYDVRRRHGYERLGDDY